MAEGNRNPGGLPPQGSSGGYGGTFPSMPFQAMQVPPYQAPYQDLFMPYAMPLPPHFQGSAVGQDNVPLQQAPQNVPLQQHYRGSYPGQYQENGVYHASKPLTQQYQANGHLARNTHMPANALQGFVSYQGNYVVSNTPGSQVAYEDGFSSYLGNTSLPTHSSHSTHSTHSSHSTHSNQSSQPPVDYQQNRTYNSFPQNVRKSQPSVPMTFTKPPPNMPPLTTKPVDALQNNITPQRSNYGGAVNNNPAKPMTEGTATTFTPHPVNTFTAAVTEPTTTNENFENGFRGRGRGGQVRGRGGGRGGRGRGGRRGAYGGDRQGQGGYEQRQGQGWYEQRQSYDQDQQKRDRANALAETAAFMQKMSLGKGEDGGEKQGKDWKNQQEKGYGEDALALEIAKARDRNRQERGFRGRAAKRGGHQDSAPQPAEGDPSQATNQIMNQEPPDRGNGRGNRGRGRGNKQDNRKLWSTDAQADTNAPGNGEAKDVKGNNKKQPKNVSKSPSPSHTGGFKEDEESQREKLTDQLSRGTYECMVCCDRIKQQHAIWSCLNCYNCFHMGCIKKWAKTSSGEVGWRCPACQGATPKVPNTYLCFCGKCREPEWNRRDVAHSCGEVCGRKRKVEWCTHKCNILCHPGPCPPCTAFIKRTCPCGAVTQDVRCSVTEPLLCGATCGKKLDCGGHTCAKPCHTGPCDTCQEKVHQSCHCGKKSHDVECTQDTFGHTSFACGSSCGRSLECGQHKCPAECHEGQCQPCAMAVDAIVMCPCGKVPLDKLYERDGAPQRKTCSDPIPTCSQPCQRTLRCGVPGAFHQCLAMCHEGPCPPCPSETPVKCRCGSMDQNVACSELKVKADEVLCKKPCKKPRQCSRHKCGMKCCIDVDHVCPLLCGRKLTCGKHKCEETCHRGNCPRCWQTSFDELTCECGAAVIYPPVPCGTQPPACDRPCSRPQSCTHPATHSCHPDAPCPPCTILVDKPCFGQHKTMRSTQCYLQAVSCGALCGKPLPCGLHKCIRVCHEKPCVPRGTLCTQKCLKPRESCGHPCSNPCHAGSCPDNPCKEMVKISCTCGHVTKSVQCAENDREYRVMATTLLASQMQNMNNGSSVDLSDIFTSTTRADKLKRLPCNEDCNQLERNRRLALALQIENPDTREKLGNPGVLFSEFMKDHARKDPNMARMVHDALTDLVLKAKESKMKSRSHSFAPMNREKRQFVHEYCEHFGCSSQSYDEEPKKNVVATAVRGMCYIPPISVLTLVQREQGQKKVPGPVWSKKLPPKDSQQGMKKLEKSSSVEKDGDTAARPPPIDYFDFDG